MSKVVLDISTSLDGFVAGPNPSLEQPLGEGGEQLHEWVFGLAAWRKPHGLSGGTTNASSEVVEEGLSRTGAVVMGRRMFSGGHGPWEDDPKADGWWGDEPPFHVPVFVLTHHAREPVPKQGGTTYNFVTDGVESAIEQARAAAADKDVLISGGADVAQQALKRRAPRRDPDPPHARPARQRDAALRGFGRRRHGAARARPRGRRARCDSRAVPRRAVTYRRTWPIQRRKDVIRWT